MTVHSIRSTDLKVEQPGVLSAAVPLDLEIINTLPQVRKTMNVNGDMADLVESILAKGQKVPGLALALSPRAAVKYLKEVNRLWGTNHTLRKLTKIHFNDRNSEYYVILVYGHRRLKGCQEAEVRRQGGEKSDYFKGTYRCDIHFDLSFEDAFSIQLLENMYVAPPKNEEAAALWRYWRYKRNLEPDLTVPKFAKEVGRRPGQVRAALRFCSLPDSVQNKIKPDEAGGKAAYSLMVEVARKAEVFAAAGKPLSELELIRLVDFLISNRVKSSDYARQVSEEIRHLHNEQQDLFAEILRAPIETKVIRKVAAAQMLQSVVRDIHYLATINAMMKTDAFGGLSPYLEGEGSDVDADYSPDSPARTALGLIKVLKGAVPDLAEMLRRDGKSNADLLSSLTDLDIEEEVFSAVLRA